MNLTEALEYLFKNDWTEAGIASAVGSHQSTINRIRRGNASPRYQLGVAIISLAGKAKESSDAAQPPADENKEAA